MLRVVRWLVRAGDPAPVRPEAEVAAEMARDYRWNFVVQALDFGLFWFAASFASSTTILPLFVSKLTSSTLPIGLVAMVAQGGWYLPQLFTANLIERLPRMKPVVVNLGFFLERVPFWLMVAAPLFALESPQLALVLLLVGWTWHNVGAGIIAPAWQDLVARCFPVERRGRFFGVAAFLGAGAGALGAGVSAWLLAELPFPMSFLAVLAIAAVGITLSWVFLAMTREPVQGVSLSRRSQSQYLSELPDLVRNDKNFARFLLARAPAGRRRDGNGLCDGRRRAALASARQPGRALHRGHVGGPDGRQSGLWASGRPAGKPDGSCAWALSPPCWPLRRHG